MNKLTLKIMLSTVISVSSLTAGSANAKSTLEFVNCSLKVVHANEQFSNIKVQSIKVDMDENEGEVEVIGKASGEEIVVAFGLELNCSVSK